MFFLFLLFSGEYCATPQHWKTFSGPINKSEAMKGWFDAFRDDGAPTLYSFSNRTPVTGDVDIVAVSVLFGTLYIAFLVIFPGVRKQVSLNFYFYFCILSFLINFFIFLFANLSWLICWNFWNIFFYIIWIHEKIVQIVQIVNFDGLLLSQIMLVNYFECFWIILNSFCIAKRIIQTVIIWKKSL